MDSKTLAFTVVLVSGAVTLLTLLLAVYRKEKHLWVFAGAFIGGSASFGLFLTQGTLTPWISVVAANLLLAGFHLGLAWGLRLWGGRSPGWPVRFTVYLLVFSAVQVLGTQVWNSYTFRAAASSVLVLVVTGDILLGLLNPGRQVPPVILRSAWAVCAGLIFCHGLRIFLVLGSGATGASFLANDGVNTYTLAFSLVFAIFWAGILLILDAAGIWDDLIRKNRLLDTLATTDPLTGLSNRQLLDTKVQYELERASRYGTPLTMVMLDLDQFKQINDTRGHDVGDQVLKKTAQTVRSLIREPDSAFRWGGEEFLILAPQTALEGGVRMAEKVRLALEKQQFPGVPPMTASFGVAQWEPPGSRELWFQQVDQALYRAKNTGRNRVVAWGREEAAPTAQVRLGWRSEWDSGNPTVDEEHHRLLEMANTLTDLSLAKAPREQLALHLDALLDHIVAHFSHEESLLKAVGYPEAELHANLHRRLVAEALEHRTRFQKGGGEVSGFLDFLVGKVVMGHLLTADQRFFPYTRDPSRAATSLS